MVDKQLESRRWWGMGGAQGPAFVRDGKACLVRGGEAGEVMDALVRRVGAACAQVSSPNDVLVVCADPTSAARMRAKLTACAGSCMGDVQVTTCRELACAVLADPESSRATGMAFSSGRTRLLAAYETDFLMEDVKTLGARPKRLREMLKFFYRGWTELSDEDPEWLFTVEEIDTFEFLTCELQYLGAVMEPQVSNLATKALRMEPQVRERFARGHVLVYGYQSLSRASQLLCQLVAGEELVVGAGPDMGIDVFESYAYPAGVDDFVRLNPAAEVVSVGERDSESGKQRDAALWETPAQEVEGTAEAIAAAVEAGENPDDIAAVCFHPWLSRQMARALTARGVQVNPWLGAFRLHGDIRELDACLGLRTVTLLRLLADPGDGMAWRSWFGFGDYLARSNQFAEMRRRVCGMRIGEGCTVAAGRRGEPGAGKDAALHGENAAEQVGCHNVRCDLAAYGVDLASDLTPLFAEVHDLRGPKLLAYLVETLAGPDVPLPACVRPLLSLGADADAQQMLAELDRLQFFSGVPARAGVTVAPYEAVADVDFKQVYVVGFTNGLFPRADYFDLTKVTVDKQAKIGEHDTRAARAMAGMGTCGLHVGSFERCERSLAERMGVKQVRIYAAGDFGGEMVEASPSIYTDVLMGRA